MRDVWSDEFRTQKYLDWEAALVRAQASLGIISKEAAAEITRVCKVENIDFERYAKETLALSQACFVHEGLEVHAERMRTNLDMTRGLIVSEAVMMMGLAPKLGRDKAHDVLYAICHDPAMRKKSLTDLLLARKDVMAELSEDEVRRLTNPEWSAPLRVDRTGDLNWPPLLGFRRMEAMTKHRSHSAAFKRQVAEEFIAGETLHALSKQHDVSRQLIRIWVGKFEARALDDDVQAADLMQEYEARIAALERLVGRRALEIELLIPTALKADLRLIACSD